MAQTENKTFQLVHKETTFNTDGSTESYEMDVIPQLKELINWEESQYNYMKELVDKNEYFEGSKTPDKVWLNPSVLDRQKSRLDMIDDIIKVLQTAKAVDVIKDGRQFSISNEYFDKKSKKKLV